MNSRVDGPGLIRGGSCWIEGTLVCRPLVLAGENVVVGVDVDQPLELPRRACLDLLPGKDRAGQPVTFVRCYGIDDTLEGGSSLCGETLDWWVAQAGGSGVGLWDPSEPPERRNLWSARVFPAEADAGRISSLALVVRSQGCHGGAMGRLANGRPLQL